MVDTRIRPRKVEEDEDVSILRNRLSSEAVRSEAARPAPDRAFVSKVLDRPLPQDEDLLYLEDGEEAPAPPPSAEPAFPPALAREIRKRAWAEYAAQAVDGEPRPAHPPARATPPVQPWIEAAGCLGAVIAVNLLFFPERPGFRGLEFNPFFAPVLLLAVRYGLGPGLAAGAAAAAWVLLAGGSADPTDGTLVLPGLLVAVGALSGVLSGRQGDRLAFARRRVAELEEERERLRKILRAKNAIVRDLQGRFEEQAEPMESLYGMSRRMGSGEWEAMFPCLLDLLAHDLKVDRAAVYGLEDGRLVLRASHDPRVGTRPFPESLPSEGGLAGRALRERRVVSVFDPEAEGEPASGLLCGPLREGGAVRGLLLVEEMPLLEFSPVVVARFASLLRWAEESSERAARLREAGSADVDRETGTYSPGRLVETLEREIARAARYDTPLRLMLVRVRSFDALPEGYRRVARQNVACALGAQTRGIDTVCSVDRPDTFAVVLSMCRGEDPAPIQERVTRSLEGMWWPFPVRLAFASADLDGRPRTPGELLAEAEARLA